MSFCELFSLILAVVVGAMLYPTPFSYPSIAKINPAESNLEIAVASLHNHFCLEDNNAILLIFVKIALY